MKVFHVFWITALLAISSASLAYHHKIFAQDAFVDGMQLAARVDLNVAFIDCLNAYAGTQYTYQDDGLALYNDLIQTDDDALTAIITCVDEQIAAASNSTG